MKMRKLTALLLAGSMVASMAACGTNSSSSKPEGSKDSSADSSSEAGSSDAAGSSEEATESSFVPVNVEPSGQVIIGSTTQMNGDWETIWSNNASDYAVLKMISGYGTVAQNQKGEYVWDYSALAEEPTTEEHEDGSKTWTFKIKEGLVYNDGTAITAKDYVMYFAVFAAPFIKEMELAGSAGQMYVGHSDYSSGAATAFSGVRLLGDYEFSITVDAENLPYYFDKVLVSADPMPVHVWLPADVTVEDDGEGVYLKFPEGVADDAKGAYVKETIEAARWNSDNRVSAGAYTLTNFDVAASTATLKVNPNYAGNFQGQKPGIETVVYIKTETATQMDLLKQGGVDILTGLSEGAEIKAALDIADEGGFKTIEYPRNGYGKVTLICDFGPTQFVEVRHALAYLLDRNEFANTFCEGYGSVVHGPYGTGMWMYEEAEDELDEKLNTYDFNVDKAIEELKNGGWVYNADGSDYVDGSELPRYKKVTEEEAADDDKCVTLADGTILMPLVLEWLSSEKNPVSELLKVMLMEANTTKQAGVQINCTEVQFTELLNYIYRDASSGDKYAVPTYNMFNLATGFTAAYDLSFDFTRDETLLAYGYNTPRIFDEELDELSMDMVYGVDADDEDTYLSLWVKFIERWNELLPEIPLYSNQYHDIYNDKIQNYNVNPLWDVSQQIIYCTVTE